ncbi:MFS transporter [Thiomonas sp.]|jgi:MFS family permease|uniref:MFS transporter n=1 Tax=Thiomonas sp. TaxID=2047785 RepID=UPI00258CB575|nr:MFS transporter [Thiomonas sp.]
MSATASNRAAPLPQPSGMTPAERRASTTLASIYGLRMLGLFFILPVFAIYAEHLPLGHDKTLVGLAMGIYGLTQALMQIPFGMASDRFGRKPVMVLGLLIFAAGSFCAGSSDNLYLIILGRAIQGAGAISAAISAMIADATREEHRTKAMALVGMTIGFSFIASLVLGPPVYHAISVPGMFILTGLSALVAIAVIIWVVPNVPMVQHAEELEGHWAKAVFTPALLKLDFSIFVVNFLQVSMFVVVPVALVQYAGIPLMHHWMVYLPVTVVSFMLSIPGIIWAEKHGYMKVVFVSSVALLVLTMFGFAAGYKSPVALIAALFFFFMAFNVMEALLPSLVSRTAPPSRKGLAMGIYNTGQSLGLFAGGAVGGLLAQHFSKEAVFLAAAALAALWLAVAMTIKPPAKRAKAAVQEQQPQAQPG